MLHSPRGIESDEMNVGSSRGDWMQQPGQNLPERSIHASHKVHMNFGRRGGWHRRSEGEGWQAMANGSQYL